MSNIRAIFLLSLAVATASAQFTVEEAASYADMDGDGILSDKEFSMWNQAVSDHLKTKTIMTMTGEIPVSKFISVLENTPKDPKDLSQYTAHDVAAFADKDKNEVISADEFDRWFRLLPPGTDKATTVMMFTGNIPLDKFTTVLDQGIKSSPFPTEYTVQQAVDYTNLNRDNEIDADEFNRWYNSVQQYRGQKLKESLTSETGVITVAGFKSILSLIQDLGA